MAARSVARTVSADAGTAAPGSRPWLPEAASEMGPWEGFHVILGQTMWSQGARRANGAHARAAQPSRRAFSSTYRFVARGLVLFWAADAVRLLRATPRPLLPTLQGVFAALFAALLVGLPASAALGALAWLSVDDARPSAPPALARLSAWLAPHDDEARIGRAADLLALPPALALFVGLTLLGGRHVVVGMARPEFAAWALVGISLGALGVSFAAWLGPLRGATRRGVRALDRHAMVSVGAVSASLAGLALAALAVFAYAYRQPLRYLPWEVILTALGAGFASALWAWFGQRAPTPLRRTFAAVTPVLIGLSALSLYPWPGELYARRIAEQRSQIGQLSYRLLKLAFDTDHDGYLPLVSGGDCAPFDPTVHPGAVDVPGNRRDEDCDGVDLDPGVLPTLGTIDHPVRSDVPARPPIVLITVDVLSAARLHALGAAHSSMPKLDAYAAQSALFERCFVQGPSTRLSFPALFTSRWDSQIKQELVGHHPYPIDLSEHTLAEILREHGYDTLAVLPDPYFSPGHWRGIGQGFNRVVESPYAPPATPHTGPRVTDAALAELARPRGAPLFLWVHYFDAHAPFEQPVDVPVLGKNDEAVYQAELGLVDRELARLLEGLAQRLPNALVIVTGDHGTAFDQPRHEKLGYGFDLSTAVLHVPLIVRAPFIAPHRVPGPVSNLDILPTLVNLLRIRGEFGFSGVSLVPELLDGKAARPPRLLSQFFLEERLWADSDPLLHASLRTERFNLIHDRTSGFYELYDYRDDYYERHDLSVEPAYQDVLRSLRQQLLVMTWMAHKFVPKSAAPAQPATTGAPAQPSPAQPSLWRWVVDYVQRRARQGSEADGAPRASPTSHDGGR